MYKDSIVSFLCNTNFNYNNDTYTSESCGFGVTDLYALRLWWWVICTWCRCWRYWIIWRKIRRIRRIRIRLKRCLRCSRSRRCGSDSGGGTHMMHGWHNMIHCIYRRGRNRDICRWKCWWVINISRWKTG